jgi:RNA polymerase sigma factor (sigma-70 family)
MNAAAWFRRSDNTPTPADPEQQLVRLLTSLHAAPVGSEGCRTVERELLEWVELHLRVNLKAIMFRTFGSQVTSDTSLQFTAIWHDVVERALRRGLDGVHRESSIRALTTFFSVALANRARDYLKRRKKGERILEDEIRPLVESREKHLWEKHQLEFDHVLEAAERWYNAGDPMGEVLRYYYVDGETYEEIGRQMDLSAEQVRRLKRKAIESLRQLARDNSRPPCVTHLENHS